MERWQEAQKNAGIPTQDAGAYFFMRAETLR